MQVGQLSSWRGLKSSWGPPELKSITLLQKQLPDLQETRIFFDGSGAHSTLSSSLHRHQLSHRASYHLIEFSPQLSRAELMLAMEEHFCQKNKSFSLELTQLNGPGPNFMATSHRFTSPQGLQHHILCPAGRQSPKGARKPMVHHTPSAHSHLLPRTLPTDGHNSRSLAGEVRELASALMCSTWDESFRWSKSARLPGLQWSNAS